ncbi:MAG: endonuclease [Clostridiales bacterium]|jgi:hypothetical protein|nr:endonuclease [Clostridiales bacterium]
MYKIKIRQQTGIASVIICAALLLAFRLTIVTVGAGGWWLVFAILPVSIAGLILNKDFIKKHSHIRYAIGIAAFFLAGFTTLFTLVAAFWITPLWLFMLFTVIVQVVVGYFYLFGGIGGKIEADKKVKRGTFIACSALFIYIFAFFCIPSFIANNGINPKKQFSDNYYTNVPEISGYTLYGGVGEIDREHVIAQSWGKGSKNYVNDLHNIFLANKAINAKRGNAQFGEVELHNSVTTLKDSSGNVCGYLGKNRKGETVFEPTDEFKGDVARAILYMDKTYGYSDFAKSKIDITLMKKWAKLDIVSSFEIRHNNAVEQKQGNRNIFIDQPWLVKFVVW